MQPLHVWHAQLDRGAWPAEDRLPAAERDRAAGIRRPRARRRWVASRWALRGVLGLYLEREPEEVELRFGERGKPMLRTPEESLRFNLSHSGGRALIAVCREREVGIDIERIGKRPEEFYAAWTRREAIAKCFGAGLGAPLPDDPVAVSSLDAGAGFAAAVAVEGDELPLLLLRFDAEPATSVGTTQLAVVPAGGP
jgi:4'-phosphopantetheinyl transferase